MLLLGQSRPADGCEVSWRARYKCVVTCRDNNLRTFFCICQVQVSIIRHIAHYVAWTKEICFWTLYLGDFVLFPIFQWNSMMSHDGSMIVLLTQASNSCLSTWVRCSMSSAGAGEDDWSRISFQVEKLVTVNKVEEGLSWWQCFWVISDQSWLSMNIYDLFSKLSDFHFDSLTSHWHFLFWHSLTVYIF